MYEGENGKTIVEPSLDLEEFEVDVEYVTRLLGVKLTPEQMNKAAVRMGLNPIASSDAASKVKYQVQPTRPDILHACDIAEEIGIGYGFNEIQKVYPSTTTVGSFIPENKFTDLMRH